MAISEYHQKFAQQADSIIDNKVRVKKEELEAVFRTVAPTYTSAPIRVAVLGCGDKRFVQKHRELFEDLLKASVSLTTLDITIEHLAGEGGVIKHDCTLPLPSGPYNITYAHVLLKFIDPAKQMDVIQNSYNALADGGIAIHVLDTEEYTGSAPIVPLEIYKSQLEMQHISFKEIPIAFGIALVLYK